VKGAVKGNYGAVEGPGGAVILAKSSREGLAGPGNPVGKIVRQSTYTVPQNWHYGKTVVQFCHNDTKYRYPTLDYFCIFYKNKANPNAVDILDVRRNDMVIFLAPDCHDLCGTV
jgi:hypothetical protein